MGERHITKVAKAIMGKLGIDLNYVGSRQNQDTFELVRSASPKDFWGRCNVDVIREVRRMTPEKLGQIIAQSPSKEKATRRNKTSMLDVYPMVVVGIELKANPAGNYALHLFATMAIVAEMFDILQEQDDQHAVDLEELDQDRRFLASLDQ